MFIDAIKHLSEIGRIPKFNPHIAEGVGYVQAKDGVLRKVDSVLNRELSHSPENPKLPVGFTYVESRILSPLEGYISALLRKPPRKKAGSSRNIVNISRTDEFLASLKFQLPDGREVYRQMYIPFIRRGGFMYSWGTEYHCGAVIHTQGISREGKSLFVNFDFTRKVKFMDCKDRVKLRVNGIAEDVTIPGSSSMYGAKEGKGHDPGPKPLPYWLFARYGFKNAIKKYCGVDVEIIPSFFAPNIDTSKKIVITSGDKSKAQHCHYALVVDREVLPSYGKRTWTRDEHVLFTMLASFFKAAHYYISKSPMRCRRGQQINGRSLFTYVDSENWEYDVENLDSPDSWMIILGRSYIGGLQDDTEVYTRVATHLIECERYLNKQFRSELFQSDPEIDLEMNTFDFLFYVVGKMVDEDSSNVKDISSMYNKRLTIVDYMLLGKFGFNATVSLIRWKIESANMNSTGDISSEILTQLNRRLGCGLIRKTENNTAAISTYSATTESLVLAVSTSARDQTETDPRGGKKRACNLNDRTKHLSISHFECGSGIYIPKSGPFRYSILNPYVLTTNKLVMVRNPELQALVKPAEEDILQIGGQNVE